MGGLTEIKSLLKSGIKKSRMDKASSIADFNKAKSIAKEENFNKELPLIESYIKLYDEKDFELSKSLLDKYLETKNVQLLGHCYFLLGKIYSEKGEHDKAIDFYQKALDTPGYDTPGDTLNNMGIACANKGEYDKAIDFYQKALDTPGYDTPGETLNNMGVAYRELKKYEEALKCHKKALKSKDIVKNQEDKIYTENLIKNTENSIKVQKNSTFALDNSISIY